MNALAALMIVCGGFTNSYEVQVDFDTGTNTYEADLMGIDGTYGGFHIQSGPLTEQDGCWVGDGTRLCFKGDSHAEFMIEIRNEFATFVEEGVLTCN